MNDLNMITKAISQLGTNPTAIQRLSLNLLETLTNGEVVIVDANNPFVYLMEISAATAAAGIAKNEILNRQQYASTAQTFEDLYPHMSDGDYLDRFATPSRTTIDIALAKDEFIKKSVVVAGTNIRKITIPKHTQFIAGENTFMPTHAIDIRILPHGGIDVLFDMSDKIPVNASTTNYVEWYLSEVNLEEFIYIRIPVYQLKIESRTAALNAVTGFSKPYNYTDRFYACRAYIRNNNEAAWTEIKTTHNEQFFDPTKPTVLLKVFQGLVNITVPQIYFNEGLMKNTIRLDIYTTKGVLDIDLGAFSLGSYKANWLDLDNNNTSNYSTPLNTFSRLTLLSTAMVVGGGNGLSFEQLRERVMDRSLTNTLPITREQVKTSLKTLGYDMVLNIDNITDRMLLATKSLPKTNTSTLSSGIGTLTQTAEFQFTKAIGNFGVYDNSDRITITPNALFKLDASVIKLVPLDEVLSIKNLAQTSPEGLALLANQSKFLFTPFYYVLDATTNRFVVRAYDLDNSKVVTRYLHKENADLQLQVSSQSYTIVNSPDNNEFIVEMRLKIGETLEAIGINKFTPQLSCMAGSKRVWFDGYLVSDIDPLTNLPVNKEYIYHFYIDTTYDVNDKDELAILDGFIPLTTVFDMCVVVRDYLPPASTVSDIDLIVNLPRFTDGTRTGLLRGIIQEKITIQIGTRLDRLWTMSRTIASTKVLHTYPADIPDRYDRDVFEMTAQNTIKLTYDPTTGNVRSNKLHSRGDIKYNASGEMQIKHYMGDVIIDSNSDDMLRDVTHQIDLVMFDGLYYFATNPIEAQQLKQTVNLIVDWTLTDIPRISNVLLDESELYFYPKNTFGNANVIADEMITVNVPLNQKIRVKHYVLDTVFRDADKKTAIINKTIQTVTNVFDLKTVSVDTLVSSLRFQLGTDIISTEVTGFMGDNYNMISHIDESAKLVIAKRLVALSNRELAIEDDIVVEFVVHRL